MHILLKNHSQEEKQMRKKDSHLVIGSWRETVVEVVGGNDEEAEGDDDGVEEVVGVQDGVLERLPGIRLSGPVLPRACTPLCKNLKTERFRLSSD